MAPKGRATWRAPVFTEQSVCTLRHGVRGTKTLACLHIDLWTRSALYFQVLGKQTYFLWVGRTLLRQKAVRACSPPSARTSPKTSPRRPLLGKGIIGRSKFLTSKRAQWMPVSWTLGLVAFAPFSRYFWVQMHPAAPLAELARNAPHGDGNSSAQGSARLDGYQPGDPKERSPARLFGRGIRFGPPHHRCALPTRGWDRLAHSQFALRKITSARGCVRSAGVLGQVGRRAVTHRAPARADALRRWQAQRNRLVGWYWTSSGIASFRGWAAADGRSFDCQHRTAQSEHGATR